MAPDNNGPTGDGWGLWAQGVNKTLKTLDDKLISLTDNDKEVAIQVATIQAKAGIIGTIAGVIASGIVSIIVGFIIYQLTTGNIHFDKTDNHPDSTIGFILPPRDEHHDPLYKILSEAKT
jgi:hypothetical protein